MLKSSACERVDDCHVLQLSHTRLQSELAQLHAHMERLETLLKQQATALETLQRAVVQEQVSTRDKAIGYLFGLLLTLAGALVAYILKK